MPTSSWSDDPAKKKMILAIAKVVGVAIDEDRNPRLNRAVLWNCQSIAARGLDCSNVLHEIAHFQVASPQERLWLDYGLGPGPESNLQEFESKPGVDNQDKEELASALGIAYEAALGLPFYKTLKYHSWSWHDDVVGRSWKEIATGEHELDNRSGPPFHEKLAELHQKKLVGRDGFPVAFHEAESLLASR